MRSKLIVMAAAGALIAALPVSLHAAENDPGPRRGALERIGAQVERLKAEGMNEREILERARSMIDRALERPGPGPQGDGQGQGPGPGLRAERGPGFGAGQGAPGRRFGPGPGPGPRRGQGPMGPGPGPTFDRRDDRLPGPRFCPHCGRPMRPFGPGEPRFGREEGPPPSQARQQAAPAREGFPNLERRIRSAIEKMRSEGKSPEEIRAAARAMRERAQNALERERPSAGEPPARQGPPEREGPPRRPGQPDPRRRGGGGPGPERTGPQDSPPNPPAPKRPFEQL